MIPRSRHAFTLLEIIVTVMLFILVFGFSLLYTQLGVLRTDLKTQASILEGHLREAQSNASAGKAEGSFGIHFESSQYVLFEGTVYDPDGDSNLVMSLPDVLRLQSIVLQGNGSDLIFDSPLGSTEEWGTFELYSTRTEETLLFTITSLGQISYE